MVIKFVAHASMVQLRKLLLGKQADCPQKSIKIIDVVLREIAAQRFILFP